MNQGCFAGTCEECRRLIRGYERDWRIKDYVVCSKCVEREEHRDDEREPSEDELEQRRRDLKALGRW